MDKQESIRLFNRGKGAWNNWARQKQADREALENAGNWNANDDPEKWNAQTRDWHRAATVDFSEYGFSGNVSFRGLLFPSVTKFSNAKFAYPISFEGAEFLGDAYFDKVRAANDVSFASVAFCGHADFENVSIGSSASFEGARFKRTANFRSAKISGKAGFDDAAFAAEAKFDLVNFRGVTQFDRADFQGDVSFSKTSFEHDANFVGLKVAGEIDFTDSVFEGDAAFSSAQLSGRTDFLKAKFHRIAQFDQAQFGGNVGFIDACFDGNVTFVATLFEQRALFSSAEFAGAAAFDVAHFCDDAFFLQAQFNGYTSFQETTFEGAASFEAIDGKRVFTLAGASFMQAPNFVQAHFTEAPRLDHASFERRGFRFPSRSAIKSRMKRDIDRIARWQALKRLAVQGHDHLREQEFFKEELRSRRWTSDYPRHATFWFGLFYQWFSDFGRSMIRPVLWFVFGIVVFAGCYLSQMQGLEGSWPARFISAQEQVLSFVGVGSYSNLAPLSCVAAEGEPVGAAFGLSIRNGFLFPAAGSRDKQRQMYRCLYGTEDYAGAVDNEQSPSYLPRVPDSVFMLGLVQNLYSALLIFLFLLAVRNHFRIR